jgi:hypothetical protein
MWNGNESLRSAKRYRLAKATVGIMTAATAAALVPPVFFWICLFAVLFACLAAFLISRNMSHLSGM